MPAVVLGAGDIAVSRVGSVQSQPSFGYLMKMWSYFRLIWLNVPFAASPSALTYLFNSAVDIEEILRPAIRALGKFKCEFLS